MMTDIDLLGETPQFVGADFDRLLDQLANQAAEADLRASWPKQQLQQLAEGGVLGWVIPEEFGGSNVSPEALVYGYERLAAACLTTTFILTQRNGACQRIAGCDNGGLKAELLPQLARGDLFATVGISHLTTSRQHVRRPAVMVTEESGGFVLDGQIPWVTGAPAADYVVTGGACEDGRQVLIALPTDHSRVNVQSPVAMLALNASETAAIDIQNVDVDADKLIAGPIEGVMQQGTGGGTGSVATSSLAVGLSVRTLELLNDEASRRPDLQAAVDQFTAELADLRRHLYAAARGECSPDTPHLTNESIRGRANSLGLRTTQALMAASKGAGFVAGHPAERAVRESMFFLVWSCPQPLMHQALREFACLVD